MGYSLKENELPATDVKRIANEQIDKAINEIDDSFLSHHETVHQVRKRCKKLRGLLRMVRPCLGSAYQTENKWYRDSAQALSNLRDAQSLVESCEQLMNHYADTIHCGSFAELEHKLSLYRDDSAAKQSDIESELAVFRQRMVEAKGRVENWPLKKKGFDLFSEGSAKTYRRARQALHAAYQEPTVDNFHEWRKRVKYHWYQTRLLKKLWPELLSCRAEELNKLSGYLGDDHDLAVLEQTIQATPEKFVSGKMLEAFVGLLRQRQSQLRKQAHPLGARLFAEKAPDYVQRLGRYWQVWKKEQS